MTARFPGTRMAAALVLVAGVLLGAALCPVTPWAVAGSSMQPVLLQGDRVLVDRWSYRHRSPRAGEVVLLFGPRRVPMVKRIARGPDGAGAVWVLGDNATWSVDSRRFGSLPAARVRGRVVFRYWPPSRAGLVR